MNLSKYLNKKDFKLWLVAQKQSEKWSTMNYSDNVFANYLYIKLRKEKNLEHDSIFVYGDTIDITLYDEDVITLENSYAAPKWITDLENAIDICTELKGRTKIRTDEVLLLLDLMGIK